MKNIILRITVVLAIIIAAVFLLNKSDLSPDGTPSVTIGMVTFPGYAPLYLAEDKELFKGIDVNLVRIEAIGDLRAAMNSGKIDMYAATFDIFQAVDGQEPPGIGFLAIDESHGGDGVVVSADINSLSDLRGKIVGAEPGFPPHFILQYLLNKEGMSLDDVDFKDIPSSDASNAFISSDIDVAGTYEPYLSIAAEKREGAKVIASSADTPGLIVDLLFASEDLTQNNPEILKLVSDGWFAAVEYWKTNPEESMQVMAEAFGVDTAEMKDIKSGMSWLTLEDNQKLFNKNTANNVYDTFELVGDILEKNGSASTRVNSTDKLSSRVINNY